jgi:hypothetical protein
MNQEELFRKYLPTFSDIEVSGAVQADGPIVSVFGRRGAPDFFLVKFATVSGSVGPMALNRTTAAALLRLLQQSGF